MDTISRRRFLALTGGTGVAAAANILNLNEIAEAAITRPLPTGTPILVVVTLYVLNGRCEYHHAHSVS